MELLGIPQQKEKAQWWIKYDTNTGRVYRISPNPITRVRKNQDTFITEDQDLILKMIDGKVNIKTCSVARDIDTGKLHVVERSNKLNLKRLSSQMFQIYPGARSKQDVFVEIFVDSHILEISINIESIKRNMNLGDIHEVTNTTGALMDMYVTEKNDPDKLIAQIEIDPKLLFKQKMLRVQLTDIDYDLSNISIFTCPIFKTYAYAVSEKDVREGRPVSDDKYIQQVTNEDDQKHLSMRYDGKYIKINSSLINNENSNVLGGNKHLHFLVCDSIIDNVIGGFQIESDQIINKNNVRAKLDFKMPARPIILYKCENLYVNYIGRVD
ncbi:hypothetical protein N8072_00435 [bacterium]|nr:hypothetical protein [bacterium]MDC1257128.1 hypothetical protein [bacterium]